jgi:pimeloyl-ACP methyl ester carboxylesterase
MAGDIVTFALKTATLPAGDVRYHVAGTGRPVIYLHAAGGVRLSQPLHALARNFTIYVPIFPGFDGTAALPGIATIGDLAALVAQFADAVIAQKCDLMGHSFGGHVAAWCAVLHPDKIDQLVLQCPAGFRSGPRPQGDPTSLLFAHPERIRPEDKEALGRAAANREVAQRYRGGVSMDEALLARLGEISALTLILQGTQDRMVAPDSARLLKSRIARSHLIYVYDAGHVIEIDQPQRFLSVVGDFLGRGEGFLVNWGHGVSGVFVARAPE